MWDFIIQRGITNLYHFTRIENLKAILFSGLVSKSDLEFVRVPVMTNDKKRLDGFPDYISCSISFPHYQMLTKYKKYIHPGSKWAIIELSPLILLEKECLFCKGNAASNPVKETIMDQKKGLIGLKNMFAERDDHITRKEMGLPMNFPTDPQAEVLVKSYIERFYIRRVIFENDIDINHSWIENNRDIEFVGDQQLFGPRCDYDFWRKKHGEETGLFGWR